MTEPKKNYGVIQAAKDLISGKLELAEPEVQQKRIDICNSCEVQNKATKVCTACGCFLPAKTRLLQSTCPMDLW